MEGFIGINDVLRNISLIAEERRVMLEWFKQSIDKILPSEPENDN